MSQRKRYVIAVVNAENKKVRDLLWHSTIQNLPSGEANKFVQPITASDIVPYLDASLSSNLTYGAITRRAEARRIAKEQKDSGLWSSSAEFRVIEVGEFQRTVRPVKHWNIERNWRRTHTKGLPWSGWEVWSKGTSLREDARAIAARLTREWNAEGMGGFCEEQFKFRAVPVYAD